MVEVLFDGNTWFRGEITKYRADLVRGTGIKRMHWIVFADGDKNWYDLESEDSPYVPVSYTHLTLPTKA